MEAIIYINNVRIDLFTDFQLSLNYSIADIREPENRTSSFSKTITIPASKTNNNLFTQIYEINKDIKAGLLNFEPDYNPTKKAKCSIYVGGVQVMNGNCQLIKINRTDQYIVSYDIVVVSENKDLIESFKDDKLNSIDLSEYDHQYNPIIIEASWDSWIEKNGNQYANFIAGQPIGEGYIYPSNLKYFKNPTISSNGVSQNDIPAVYLKTYIDKIFEKAGKRYTSYFFNSQYFKNLIVPATKYTNILNQDQLGKILFEVNDVDLGSTNFKGQTTSYQNIKLIFRSETIPNPDYEFNLDVYDPSTPYVGTLTYKGDWNCFLNLEEPGYTPTSNSGNVTIIQKLIEDINGYKTVLATNTESVNLSASDGTFPIINLANKAGKPNNKFETTLTYTGSFNNAGNTQAVYYVETNLFINTDFRNFSNNVIKAVTEFDYRIYEQRFYNEVDNNSIPLNGTLNLNQFIDEKITIKDFLSSVVKCFNLYIEPDSKDPSNFFIEPYEYFYNSTEKKDWTSKIDTTDIQITPLNSLGIRSYKFGFEKDEDILNKVYTENHKEIYGDYKLTVTTDFNTDDKEIKPLFAPTPLCDKYSLTNYENIFFNEKEEPIQIKVRLLTYGGVRDDGGGSYCYVGEVDDPIEPNVAIRFDLAPSELYYHTTTLTNNTLFNKFYRKYVKELTDINSKLITVKARLTPLDIANLRFNDKIWIIDSYFKLNKISNYNPLQDGLCDVELISTGVVGNFITGRITVGATPKSYNIVEGGEDEIRDVGATSFYNLVEGGEDEVRDLGATSEKNLINGGKDVI